MARRKSAQEGGEGSKISTEYSGRGDPVRSVQLLWGTRERPSRGPKPGMSLERIVEAAIEIADREGLSALSMQRVASHLGFTAMSLYRYVPGKAELLDVMLDTVVGEVELLEGVPGGWRAKLEGWARQEWALYHRHPWMLHIAQARPTLGPNGMAMYEYLLHAVSGTGLTEHEMLSVVHLVIGYVRGMARSSVDAVLAEQQTGVTDEQWWAERDFFWENYFDPSRFPTFARLQAAGALDELPFRLEPGLQYLLDGIESLVRARSGEAARPCDETGGPSGVSSHDRDETSGSSERAEPLVCVTCGGPLAQAATGRPRDYCSRACQQRAYRERRAAPREPPAAPREAAPSVPGGTPPRSRRSPGN